MADDEKINFLKSDIDTSKLVNDYDHINANMYQFKQAVMAGKPPDMDQKEYDTRLDDYLDRFYLEQRYLYGRLGVLRIMPDQQVFKQHYKEIAENYNLDDFYLHGFKNTVNSNLLQLGYMGARTIKTMSFFGTRALQTGADVFGGKNWRERIEQEQAIPEELSKHGWWETHDTIASTDDVYNRIRAATDTFADTAEAYDMFRPYNHAYQFGLSAGIQLLAFKGLGKVLGETSMGDKLITNYTQDAFGNGALQQVIENGVKGAKGGFEFGGLTLPFKDKREAFSYAVNGGILGIGLTLAGRTLFYRRGKLFVKPAGPSGPGPAPGTPARPAEGFYNFPEEGPFPPTAPTQPAETFTPRPVTTPAMPEQPGKLPIHQEGGPEHQQVIEEGKKNRKLFLMGKESAPAHVNQEISDGATAQQLIGKGRRAVMSSFDMAYKHMLKMETMTPEQVSKYENDLIKKGKPEDAEMLHKVGVLRSLIRAKGIGDLTTEDKANILSYIQANINRVGKNLVKYSPGLQEILKRRLMSFPVKDLNVRLIQHLIPEAQRKLGPKATNEQILEVVKSSLADTVVKMHKLADEKATNDPVSLAKYAEENARRFRQTMKPPIFWEDAPTRTPVDTSPTGYKKSPQWKAYMKFALDKVGQTFDNETVSNYVSKMSDREFAADIHSFFIPKFLKDMNITFEAASVNEEGVPPGNHNLYAFAWNFRDQMPAPYAARLEKEMMKAPFVESFYKEIMQDRKLKPTEKKDAIQSLYRQQALVLWNQVDNFLNSGHFPRESRLYQNLGSAGHDKGLFEQQIIDDRNHYEEQQVSRMFKAGSEEAENSMSMLKFMQNLRQIDMLSNDPNKVFNALKLSQEIKTSIKKKKFELE